MSVTETDYMIGKLFFFEIEKQILICKQNKRGLAPDYVLLHFKVERYIIAFLRNKTFPHEIYDDKGNLRIEKVKLVFTDAFDETEINCVYVESKAKLERPSNNL